MHAKCHALTQGIRAIKTFIKWKRAFDKFITKKQGISFECWDHFGKIKSIS